MAKAASVSTRNDRVAALAVASGVDDARVAALRRAAPLQPVLRLVTAAHPRSLSYLTRDLAPSRAQSLLEDDGDSLFALGHRPPGTSMAEATDGAAAPSVGFIVGNGANVTRWLDAPERALGAASYELVYVTRMSQPINETDLELLPRLCEHCYGVFVILLIWPGESMEPGEEQEIERFARRRLVGLGIAPARILGVTYHRLFSPPEAHAVLERVAGLPTRQRGAAWDAYRTELSNNLIAAEKARVEEQIATSGRGFDAAEAGRHAERLSSYLSASARALLERDEDTGHLTAASARRAAEATLRDWVDGNGIEGAWLAQKIAPRRPDVGQALLEMARSAWASHLVDERFSPPVRPSPSRAAAEVPAPPAPPLMELLTRLPELGERLAIALGLGLLLAAIVAVVPRLGDNGILVAMAALLGLVVGLKEGPRIKALALHGGRLGVRPGAGPAMIRVVGWEAAHDEIVDWFRGYLVDTRVGLLADWAALEQARDDEE